MIQKQINEFISIAKKEIESHLSTTKKNILVVSYYPTYRKQYGNLISLLKKDYNVITIVERILNDDFEKSAHHNVLFPWRIIENGKTYYLNADIKGVDLILSADQVGYEDGKIDLTFLSTKAKRIYFPHSLMEKMGDANLADYILVPSTQALESFKEQKNTRAKLLKSGYPKLDESISNYAYKSANTITYAPSLRFVKNNNMSLNLFTGFENLMIESLLDCTNYNISFRAHPMNYLNKHPFYELVKVRWRDNKRVIFDEKLGSDFYDYSDILVTDISTTAYTYSFTTLRPSVFFAPLKLDIFLAKFISHISVRGGGGQICSLKDLKNALSGFNLQEDSKRIKDFRDSSVYNVGKSTEVILEQINEILKGKL